MRKAFYFIWMKSITGESLIELSRQTNEVL